MLKSSSIKFIVYTLYVICLIVGLYNHEMWRDEYDWFLQARDTANFFDLGKTMSPGHGMIWRSCLWLINRFSENPVSMKVFHGFIAAGFAYILLFKSPFKVWQSAILLAGYFLLFEYAVISRCYAFGVLFLFLFARNYSRFLQLTWSGGILLLLLSNTSIYALMITSVLTAWLFFNQIFNDKQDWWTNTLKQLPVFLLIGAGILISSFQIIPDPENSFPIHLVTYPIDDYRLREAITQFFSAFVPICRFQHNYFWNTNFAMNLQGLVHWFWVLVLFIFVSVPFIRKSSILLLWLSGVLLILFFQYYTGFRYARYYGHFFLLWLTCCWLMTLYSEKNMLFQKLSSIVFTCVILVQAVGGIMMYIADYEQKFSRGEDASTYLIKNVYANSYIIGTKDYELSPIAGRLRRKIYYIESQALGSYTRYDQKRHSAIDSNDLTLALATAPNGEPFIFITSKQIKLLTCFNNNVEKHLPASEFKFQNYLFTPLVYFPAGIEPYEEYWIFKVTRL